MHLAEPICSYDIKLLQTVPARLNRCVLVQTRRAEACNRIHAWWTREVWDVRIMKFCFRVTRYPRRRTSVLGTYWIRCQWAISCTLVWWPGDTTCFERLGDVDQLVIIVVEVVVFVHFVQLAFSRRLCNHNSLLLFTGTKVHVHSVECGPMPSRNGLNPLTPTVATWVQL